MSSWCGT